MELMFLVYAVENLTYGGSFFIVLLWSILGLIAVVMLLSLIATVGEDQNYTLIIWEKLPKKTLVVVSLFLITLHTLVPSRQTAIYMASAYAIQQVVTADRTKELADKGYNALASQLDKWSKEVPEVADMLVDAGLTTVKDKVSETK